MCVSVCVFVSDTGRCRRRLNVSYVLTIHINTPALVALGVQCLRAWFNMCKQRRPCETRARARALHLVYLYKRQARSQIAVGAVRTAPRHNCTAI